MTEERMICEFHRRTMYGPGDDWWEPVEPAPPKDWKPRCYVPIIDAPEGGCWFELDVFKDGVTQTFNAPCNECPYRKVSV